jgi:hypothetical protein
MHWSHAREKATPMLPLDLAPEPARRRRRALFGAIVLVLAAVPLACGSGDSNSSPTTTPSPAPGDSPVPQPTLTRSVEAGPVTISLVDVVTTSTRSDFMLEFATDVPTPAFGGRTVLLSDDSVSVIGVEAIRPVVLDHDTPDPETYIIHAGPPTFDAPLVVTVDGLLLQRDGPNELIDGPWSFTVPVDQLEPDPVHAVVELNESVEAEGVEVTVNELRFSSDEILVLYTLSSELHLSDDLLLEVLMELPDGAVIDGDDVEGGYTGPPRDWVGDHVSSLPPLPKGVATFKLRFGPYLTPIPGGVTTITLPDAASLATPGSYAVESATESVGGAPVLVADELAILEDGGVRIRMRPNPSSTGVMAPLPRRDISAEDNLGNAYAYAGGGISVGTKADGSIPQQEDLIRLEGPIDPAATQLIVRVSNFAMLLTGPWEFHTDSPLAND